MKKLWYLFLMYVWPRRFINACISKSGHTNEDQIENVKQNDTSRIKKIRKSHAIYFLLVTFLSILGFLVALTINTFCPFELFFIRVFRLISIIVIAWAVLSKLTWEIQSWKGESLPEQVNSFSFKFFYSLGIFMAVIAIFLVPNNVSA